MKKVLMMVVGIALLASAANAQTSPQIALYADEACSVMEFMGMGMFDLYVWILPGSNGVSVAEYQLGIEGTNMIGLYGTVENEAITLASGAAWGPPGVRFSIPCQMSAFWGYKFEFGYMGTEDFIVVMTHDEALSGAPESGGCDADKTLEELFVHNKFGLNQDGEVPNESSTWGAIKSLINE